MSMNIEGQEEMSMESPYKEHKISVDFITLSLTTFWPSSFVGNW